MIYKFHGKVQNHRKLNFSTFLVIEDGYYTLATMVVADPLPGLHYTVSYGRFSVKVKGVHCVDLVYFVISLKGTIIFQYF